MFPINNPLPRAAFLAVSVFSFVLVGLRKGLGFSTGTFLCIGSLRVGGFYLRCWAGGHFCYAFGVFDFSHEEVKRVVAIVYRFFSLYSSGCMRLFVP